jgi:hypothetical protein
MIVRLDRNQFAIEAEGDVDPRRSSNRDQGRDLDEAPNGSPTARPPGTWNRNEANDRDEA